MGCKCEGGEDYPGREHGADYNSDVEVIIGTILAGQPKELVSFLRLVSPGLSVSYKVYGVLTTGNERGSEAVQMTRPA